MIELAHDQQDKERWLNLHHSIKANSKKHLWDPEKNKFIPHLYVDGSPFPEDFNENEIHYHGGTAIAIEAGILEQLEISQVIRQLKENVELSGAPSIGLTLYPPYPTDVLAKNISPPYNYQNGGDWTWFGGRMIQQLIQYGFVEEAYVQIQPMVQRVKDNEGFFEWYTVDNKPKGSGTFRGSAGVLYKAIQMFDEYADKN